MSEAAIFKCSVCGAPAHAGDFSCRYCGAGIATVCCSRCFQMNMAHAHHCSGCGAELGLIVESALQGRQCSDCPQPARSDHRSRGQLAQLPQVWRPIRGTRALAQFARDPRAARASLPRRALSTAAQKPNRARALPTLLGVPADDEPQELRRRERRDRRRVRASRHLVRRGGATAGSSIREERRARARTSAGARAAAPSPRARAGIGRSVPTRRRSPSIHWRKAASRAALPKISWSSSSRSSGVSSARTEAGIFGRRELRCWRASARSRQSLKRARPRSLPAKDRRRRSRRRRRHNRCAPNRLQPPSRR